MNQLRNSLTYIVLAVAFLLEMILIASQVNHGRREGHEVGSWAVRMSDGWTRFFAWTVAILVAWAFVRLAARLSLGSMCGLLGAVVLIEVLWGKILPRPQNSWELALAFALGAVLMLWHVLSETDFVSNARGRLAAIWGH